MFDTKRFNEIEQTPSRFRFLEQIPLFAEDSFPIKLKEPAGDEVSFALIDFERSR